MPKYRRTTGLRGPVAFLAAFFILLPAGGVAGAPGWVKAAIAAAEGIEVDPEAPALILLNNTDIEIKADGGARTKSLRAVKILSPSGVAESKLVVQISDYTRLVSLKGYRIRPDGSEENLKKEYVVVVGLQESAGYHDDLRRTVVVWPDVSTNDVFAYEYELDEKDRFDGFFQSFLFQRGLPVARTRLTVSVPAGWELHTSQQALDPLTQRVEMGTHIWEGGPLAYRPEEPCMPPWKYVDRRILLSCYKPGSVGGSHFADWGACGRWTMHLHREPSICDSALRTATNEIIAEIDTPTERLRAIAAYVRDNVRYVAVEIGDNRFTPRFAHETFENRYGDCKDKVTLMRAMLEAVEIPSRPVLASIGGWVDRDFPTPFQFNHVIVAVPTASLPGWAIESKAAVNGWLYFDPTDPAIALGDLPTALYGSHVLRSSDSASELLTLPGLSPDDRFRSCFASLVLDRDGSISGDLRITDRGARAAGIAYNRATTPVTDQISDLQVRMSSVFPQLTISDYAADSDGDSAWITLRVSGTVPLVHAGDMILLRANVFETDIWDDLPRGRRVHPVWLGAAERTESEIHWHLPEGWSLADRADSISYQGEPGEVTCMYTFDQSRLTVDMSTTSNGVLIDPEQYESARQYVQVRRKTDDLTVMLSSNGKE
ncbi:MAG: DUF3857 and transglutaminase domain-containing protein [candidate division Zixibacteria bacterium]|jgi:hypothetical protein|nr:DUF3857 and transglutaminase domain-containing protein [candidate division Zixibacteria bacterium]